MSANPHSQKQRCYEALAPMLRKAIEEFGSDRLIEAAFESPIGKDGRFYRHEVGACAGLKKLFRGEDGLSWSTMKAYSWALQHLYPYAEPNETLRAIDRHPIGPSKRKPREELVAKPEVVVSLPEPTLNGPVDVDEVGLDLLASHDWLGLAKLAIEQMRAER